MQHRQARAEQREAGGLVDNFGNLFKVPFSASLGLINPASLGVDLWLGPFAIVGALVGRPIVERLNQRLFELLALALTFVAALAMMR